MNRHSSAVHSVRFSFFGQYLASGGADGRVIVYHLLPGDGGIPLGSKVKNNENWKVLRVYQQALDISEVQSSQLVFLVISCCSYEAQHCFNDLGRTVI